MFVDTAKIIIKAGDGGNGCVSFRREKYVAAGGPDGGDGGKGGDVVFKVSDSLSTLSDFRYRRKFSAQNGENGKPKRSYGKSGEDLIVKVPRGTLIKEAKSGRILQDMSADKPFTVAKGGRGGWGNRHFATPTRQVPRFAKSGIPGDELELTLELKLLADVGLLGFPNVGKSSLLSRVSEAKPTIANYHFTTLTPVLGVVSVGETSFVMADIPGLIEGAGHGAGLGHEFLRHVERCRLLVHIVDVSGSEGRDPIKDFETINKELASYSAQLAARPQIVAANKTDLAGPEEIERFGSYIEKKGFAFYPISAAAGNGLRALIEAVAETLSKLPPVKVYEPEAEIRETAEQRYGRREVDIKVKNGVYYVESPWLLKILQTIDPSDSESLHYMQRVLRGTGVFESLEKAGIREGDTVNLYDMEFDYVK